MLRTAKSRIRILWSRSEADKMIMGENMELWSKEQIIDLINQILDVENHTEEEINRLVEKYIFWDDLTPEQIADKALSYKPICL